MVVRLVNLEAQGRKMSDESMPAGERFAGRAPTHPGAIVREDVLPALGLTEEQLAYKLDIPLPLLQDILHERCALTFDVAIKFAGMFGMDVASSMRMQAEYDLWHAERKHYTEDGYYYLLREAFDTSEEVDMYDLHSEDPASLCLWEQLVREEHRARTALVHYILTHSDELLKDPE